MKKYTTIRYILVTVLLIIVLYIAFCLYLSIKINFMINDAYNNNGILSDKYTDIVSEDKFRILNYRKYHYSDQTDYREEHNHSFPFTFITFGQAYSSFKYSYKRLSVETGDVISASHNVPIHIKLRLINFKWSIEEIDERP